ncbi:MAG: hypothetical protein O9270_00120 [Aquidulcibacter sp.]|jgi:pimeloyl-ACP methyl ester carboxylesterase|nr:hypothetical protein [Aquidulcibacter sp.]
MAVMPWLFDRLVIPLSLVTPLAAMSANKRMQAYFENDPFIGKSWKAARFFRMVHKTRIENWALRCPLLLVHPGQDAWTPTELSLVVYEKIQTAKCFLELSNGSHLPVEEPANVELICEADRFLNGFVLSNVATAD